MLYWSRAPPDRFEPNGAWIIQTHEHENGSAARDLRTGLKTVAEEFVHWGIE
jgi:hypothetical protein